MSAAPGIVRAVAASSVAVRQPAVLGQTDPPSPGRRLATRVSREWLPRVAWTLHRTGRPGLLGIALLCASTLFWFSTHIKIAAEVDVLRAEVLAARRHARPASADRAADLGTALPPLPRSTDLPAVLRQIFNEATKAKLAVDTGKYEVKAAKGSGVVRYHVAFPVTGPYPQIRSFIDATLAAIPAVALSDLAIERKAIADGEVEAQVRMTVYTAAPGTGGLARAGSAVGASANGSEARLASDRVVPPTHAGALFAQHSWTVLPKLAVLPPPPPVEAPPPPPPTAPPLPYSFLGSFAPGGDPPVFFLAHGDRMLNAHIGDLLEGVYQLESAAGGQLVFVYLPLNIRQNLSAGASK